MKNAKVEGNLKLQLDLSAQLRAEQWAQVQADMEAKAKIVANQANVIKRA